MGEHAVRALALGLLIGFGALLAPVSAQEDKANDERTIWEYPGEYFQQNEEGTLKYRGERFEQLEDDSEFMYEGEHQERELGPGLSPTEVQLEGLDVEPYVRLDYELTPYFAGFLPDATTNLDPHVAAGLQFVWNCPTSEFGVEVDLLFAAPEHTGFDKNRRKRGSRGNVVQGTVNFVWRPFKEGNPMPFSLLSDYWVPWLSAGFGVITFTDFDNAEDRYEPLMSAGLGMDYKWSDTMWLEFGFTANFAYSRFGKGYNSIVGFYEPYLGLTIAW